MGDEVAGRVTWTAAIAFFHPRVLTTTAFFITEIRLRRPVVAADSNDGPSAAAEAATRPYVQITSCREEQSGVQLTSAPHRTCSTTTRGGSEDELRSSRRVDENSPPAHETVMPHMGPSECRKDPVSVRMPTRLRLTLCQ